MLRLRMWARIGLVALFVAMTSVWVTVSVAPPVAASPGTKAVDPGTGDPSGGGGPTVGDPDGPTGDIAPSGGAVSASGSSFGSGTFNSAVQTPTVGAVSTLQPRLSLWARFRLALGFWLRASVLHP